MIIPDGKAVDETPVFAAFFRAVDSARDKFPEDTRESSTLRAIYIAAFMEGAVYGAGG